MLSNKIRSTNGLCFRFDNVQLPSHSVFSLLEKLLDTQRAYQDMIKNALEHKRIQMDQLKSVLLMHRFQTV